MKDIRDKRIRPIIPLSVIFKDDPVRMIRAVKYAATTGFKLPMRVKWKIKQQSPLLASISSSRLTEEMFKIIHSSFASLIVENLEAFGLYEYLQPNASELIKKSDPFRVRYMKSLTDMAGSGVSGEDLVALIRDYLEDFVDWDGGMMENYKNAFLGARQFVLPINPPRSDLDYAVRRILGEHGITIKRSRVFERGKSWFSFVETPSPPEIPGAEGPKRKHRSRKRHKGTGDGGLGEGLF
jgi:poly(A) polymerase